MKAKFLLSVVALLLAAAPAIAQTPTQSAPTEAPQKSKKELERKALVMLDELIKDAQSFKLADNRLRLKAYAASLLWKHDETRARILFKETMAGVVDLLNTQDESDSPQTPFRRGVAQLRQDVVTMMAAHDARMAREFLRATRPQMARKAENNYPEYGNYDPELQFEYGLASQVIETDPKQALEIATDNLSRGYSQELLNTLRALKTKDRESATKLAEAIVTKLRSENLTTNQGAANIAFELMSIVLDVGDKSEDKEAKSSEPLLAGQSLRELMEMNVTLALTSRDPGRLQALDGLMPQVEKYAPARAAEIRSRVAQYKKAASAVTNDDDGTENGDETSVPDWLKYQGIVEKGTAEEVLTAAAKAPPNMRDYLYQSAAMKFADKGDLDRARDILNNNLASPYLRKQLLSELERRASLTAAEQGKIEQVRKSVANLRTNEERAMMLAQIAATLAAKGELKIALQLLDEAQGMVNYRAKNITQLGAQLLVAQSYVKLAPERSLAQLEAIVDQLNELLAAAVTLGGFILDEEVMHDDEIRLEIFTSALPMFSSQYTPDLRLLATFDFERTRSLAERFQRDEVRMMARLLVIQSVLGEQVAPEQPGASKKTEIVTTDATTPTGDSKAQTDGTPE